MTLQTDSDCAPSTSLFFHLPPDVPETQKGCVLIDFSMDLRLIFLFLIFASVGADSRSSLTVDSPRACTWARSSRCRPKFEHVDHCACTGALSQIVGCSIAVFVVDYHLFAFGGADSQWSRCRPTCDTSQTKRRRNNQQQLVTTQRTLSRTCINAFPVCPALNLPTVKIAHFVFGFS